MKDNYNGIEKPDTETNKFNLIRKKKLTNTGLLDIFLGARILG